jgi:hypothetical protein
LPSGHEQVLEQPQPPVNDALQLHLPFGHEQGFAVDLQPQPPSPKASHLHSPFGHEQVFLGPQQEFEATHPHPFPPEAHKQPDPGEEVVVVVT